MELVVTRMKPVCVCVCWDGRHNGRVYYVITVWACVLCRSLDSLVSCVSCLILYNALDPWITL
jgi:hypothetical protein